MPEHDAPLGQSDGAAPDGGSAPVTGPLPWHRRNPGLAWTLLLIVPLGIVLVGLLVRPDIFYDRYVWRSLWGPLLTDARQVHSLSYHGIDAIDGYTIESELTFGIILAVSLYWIYTSIFVRRRVKADGWFVLALVPYMLLGPVARVLEDANVFCRAGTYTTAAGCDPGFASYLFISPIIYVQIAVYVLAFLALGIFVRDRAHAPWQRLTLLVGAVALAEVAGYGAIVTLLPGEFSVIAPVWIVALAALVGIAFFMWRARAGRAGINPTLFALGLPLIAPALHLVARWLSGRVWAPEVWQKVVFVNAGVATLALAAGTVGAVALAAFLARRWAPQNPVAPLYLQGLNLALIFAHMIDGWATYIALKDPFHFGLASYGEKHPVSSILLDIANGLGFPLAKLAMVVVIVFLLDREFAKDASADRNLVGLLKMAIFALGFGPGLRDLLRISMGV